MNLKILNTLLIRTILISATIMGQEPEYLQLMKNPAGVKFSDIQKKAEDYFSGQDKTQGSYKQYKRWEWLTQNRLMPDGTIANATAMNMKAIQEYNASKQMMGPDQTESTFGYWDFLAPTSHTLGAGWNGGIGRVNCITFHPTLANTIYIGMPSGGLWRTTDGGSTWTCLTDGIPTLGVSGIAIDYNNTNIMYILTGDGDGGDTQSIGVLKTTDGGVTWYPTGLNWNITDLNRGYKLLMHPSTSSTLFAATTQGLFKTTNSGNSWTNVKSGNIYDAEFKPGTPATMYCCTGSQFYRSTNTGDTWTLISSGTPSGTTRIAIGVTPNNVSYVYLFTGPTTAVGAFKGVFRSTDSGVNFSTQATTPNLLGYDAAGNDSDHQTTYDLAVCVSRTDAQDLITGGINCWMSTNGGVGWTISSHWYEAGNTIGYTHADIHALEVNPLNNWVYCGSDGGFYRSTNFGLDWTDLSPGIACTQWYRIEGTESNSNLLVGGTQDNGSNKWTGGTGFTHVRGADGMDAMVDHSNSNIFYTTRQYGYIEKTTNGGTSFTGVAPTSGSWVTPLIMDPSNASILYAGYADVYKSTNGGSSWTNTGADGRGAMAMGVNNTSVIYASNGSTIYRSDNAAGTWATKSTGLPAISITFIAVDNTNSSDVFVTYGGYTSGQKVYESINGGDSWTNISGSLPNVPINCIAYDFNSADGIYVGTDIGVFYRDDNLGDWIPFQNGLPTVRVFDIEINETAGLIRAATYGRGLWSSDLFSGCPTDYFLTTGNDPSNPNYTGFQLYNASNSVTSTRVITGGIGTDVTYQAGNYITLGIGFNAKEGNLFRAKLGPCYTSDKSSGDITEEKNESVEKNPSQ
jgi:hypothetical protein